MKRPQRQAPDRFLTLDDVAARLQVSTRTVRRWTESAALPHHRLGRQIRIAERDLQQFLHARWIG